jgi:methionyl-tRNA formyltransferase
LRVVFFGTPLFAVPTLQALMASSHEVVLIVTQPDRPFGRGHQPTGREVKAFALAAGLPLVQPHRLADEAFLSALRDARPDIGVVAAYGKLLPRALLELPPLGFLNVHASLLPRYRGAAPVHRAVIAGERETGVTIMRVVEALDAGPTLAARARPIDKEETAEEVERGLADLGGPLMVHVLDDLAAGRARETPQDDSQATYAPRLRKDEGQIDWTEPAGAIHNLVRGLTPWPRAFTSIDGVRLIVHGTRVGPPQANDAGVILDTDAGTVRVACGGATTLEILRLQLAGKRELPADEFLRGFPIAAGKRMGT